MKTEINHISSKLPGVETTIFTVMSALAAENKALNLSQGFPNFPVDPNLISLVEKAMRDGFNQYAPMQGDLKLRELLAHKIEKRYGTSYYPDTEITVTAGATQAIFTAISAFIKEGDEVIIFTPAYDCYQPAIELNGGNPVFVPLKSTDYAIHWDEVKKVISSKTKMIIINSPHNPSGKVVSKDDMLELEKITSGSDIIVLSDEVYEHIIFDEIKHESVAKFEELSKRSLAVYSFGKTFHVTGWKMGYIIGPEMLMKEFRKVHQFNVFACNHPMQVGIANYLENESSYEGIEIFYQQKRDLFLNAIVDSRFKPLTAKGTYFQLLDYSAISDENDVDFAKRLTKEFKIASIPISVFYNTKLDEKVLRFCFAKDEETILKAGEILSKI